MRVARLVILAVLSSTALPAMAQVTEPGTARTSQTSDVAAEFVTGVEYRKGDYSTGQEVETLTVQNGVQLRAGRATVSATLPWHRIEAPANVVSGGGLLGLPIIIDPTRPTTRTRREGIGDLRIGAAYALPQVAGLELGVNGQVKLPTAASGLGTGATDITVGGDVSRNFGGVTPYVSLAYTIPGDPGSYELRNSLSARGGIGVGLAPGVRGDLSYNYAQSLGSSVPDEQQVSTGLSASLNRKLSLGIYGNAGLTGGAPDVGAGVSLGFRLF